MGYAIIPMEEYLSLVNKAKELEMQVQLKAYEFRQSDQLKAEIKRLKSELADCKEKLAP